MDTDEKETLEKKVNVTKQNNRRKERKREGGNQGK